MKTSLAHLFFGMVLLSLGATCLQAQSAHLVMQSDPGDYIGQGQNYDITYTPQNSYYFSPQVRGSLPNGQPAKLLFVLGAGPTTPFALLFFGTDQLGIPMQPGIYMDAQRADFASPGHPGLDIGFDHRGSNTLTGNFKVIDFTYSATAGIQSFTATFEQHSEGMTPALRGTFIYQAVPEPSTWVLVIGSLGLVGMIFARRQSLSSAT